jgi:hypothetical protein
MHQRLATLVPGLGASGVCVKAERNAGPDNGTSESFYLRQVSKPQ